MILYTLTAVLVGGAGVVASVLTPPSSVVARQQTVDRAALVQTAGRSPASAEPQFSSLTLDDKGTQAVDFALPCEGAESRFSKNVVQVRLTGELCDVKSNRSGRADKREIASSEIRNMTNGFSATVFYPKASSFTTDYMTLAPGQNHIKILHILKAGTRLERDFVIERL